MNCVEVSMRRQYPGQDLIIYVTTEGSIRVGRHTALSHYADQICNCVVCISLRNLSWHLPQSQLLTIRRLEHHGWVLEPTYNWLEAEHD